MGFDEFWLQSNNGKKISFEKLKELKKSDLEGNAAFIKIFNYFNTNGDEKLDSRELSSLFADILTAANFGKGKDKSIFEAEEAEEYISTAYTQEGSLKDLGVKASDLFDFINVLLQNDEKADTKSSIPKIDKPKNSLKAQAEQEKREIRKSAAQNVGLAYDNAINIIKQYQGNQGWINVGFWREKFGKALSKVNPTNI